MSAQVYPPQTYSRTATSSRHPLVNGAKYNIDQQQQQQQLQEVQKTPPLPRQNSKTAPPSPPNVIVDMTNHRQYQRVGFLGEGGFARVYEVKDSNGLRVACKVVTKASLKTKKAKTKLWAEIKIHKSLSHPNIVTFRECFEDDDNVYMTLELCHSGSLMDMLRRRRRFTEPEARFFMVQLIGACHYMHTHQVIHRDLKLGNLFLDANMNIKVGDFGLAALIENEGERKKTICGTPNYIAPEVLFDTVNGHSFEVDTWSIGVILYTLAVGRPPFQTKDVKAIYKRIRENDYEFPSDREVSTHAKKLVQIILTQDPQERPTLHEIVDHPFFTTGIFPPYIPTTAYDAKPNFSHIGRLASDNNFARVKRQSLLDEDQASSIAAPKSVSSSASDSASVQSAAARSVAQQEKEFQKAVQPGSPISALLSSARQPLMMGTANTGNRESPLFRKLQAASTNVRASPLGQGSGKASVGKAGGRGLQNIEEEEGRWAQEEVTRRKELEAQKARIVAQMVPVKEEDPNYISDKGKMKSKKWGESISSRERENLPPPSKHESKYNEAALAKATVPPLQPSAALDIPQLNAFDAAAHTLTLAFEARNLSKLFKDPRADPQLPLPQERVFISSWLDYCNKYGMAYALTDGSVGVHFNDSTTLILSADKQHFEYISSRKNGAVFVRKSYTVEQYPEEELKSKVYLLKHFERYIMDRLWGDHDFNFMDVERTKGMHWVQKYLRMKSVIVFKLSHDVLQFNFYDHTKLVLSSHGLVVGYIDKNYKLTRWTLREIMTHSLRDYEGLDAEQARFFQKLSDKLKYCKEVLVSIRTASASGGEPVATGSLGLNSKTSKVSLI